MKKHVTSCADSEDIPITFCLCGPETVYVCEFGDFYGDVVKEAGLL